ncbi:MAG: GNAT family N-acetyltransferase [Oligoflexales bacterium]|nr:GNAT family N-acetyltransferase [Oligoflexales bacterium]
MDIRIEKVWSDENIKVMIDFQKRMALETEGLTLNEQTLAAGVRSVIEDPKLGHYFLAYANDDIAGSLLTIPEWSDWRNQAVLWIHSVYIKPEYRKCGISRAMYQHLTWISNE